MLLISLDVMPNEIRNTGDFLIMNVKELRNALDFLVMNVNELRNNLDFLDDI